MMKNDSSLAFLSNREMAVYLLCCKRELESESFKELSLEKQAAEEGETLEIVARIEERLGIEDAKGSALSRINKLVDFLCSLENIALVDLEEELEGKIQKGTIPTNLDELQKDLARHEEQLRVIGEKAKALARKSTLPPEFITRLIKAQALVLQASGQIGGFDSRDQPAVARAYTRAAGVVASRVLRGAGLVKDAPKIGEQLANDPKIKRIIKGVPLSARAAFSRDLQRSLPSSVAQTVTGVGAGLEAQKQVQRAARELADRYGFSLGLAKKTVEEAVSLQVATLSRAVKSDSPQEAKVIPGGMNLAAAKMTVEAINYQKSHPNTSAEDIAEHLTAQTNRISREVSSTVLAGFSKSRQEAVRLNVEKILADHAPEVPRAVEAVIANQEQLAQSVNSLKENYGLSHDASQRVVGGVLEKEQAFLEEVFGKSPAIPAEAVPEIAASLSPLVIRAGFQPPRLTEKETTNLEKEVERRLSKKLPPTVRKAAWRLIKKTATYRRLASRVNLRVNSLLVREAIDEASREVLVKLGKPPAPSKLIAAQLVEMVSGGARVETIDQSEVEQLAAVITHRVRAALPQAPIGETEAVIKQALGLAPGLTLKEKAIGNSTQKALRVISTTLPEEQEVIKEEVVSAYRDLLLEQGVPENIAPLLAANLVASQLPASLYEIEVAVDQIPPEIIDRLTTSDKDQLGKKDALPFWKIVSALEPGQEELFLPLLEEKMVDTSRVEILTPAGFLKVMKFSQMPPEELKEFGEKNTQILEWFERLRGVDKEKFSWLESVVERLGQESRLVKIVENNPIYRFRQRFIQAKAKLLRPIGDFAVRTLSFGRLPTWAAAKTTLRNWFFKTGVGQAVRLVGAKASQKIASLALKTGAKKLLSSAAGKAIAAGLSTVLGASTGGVSLLIQAGIMALGWVAKKVVGLGKKLLQGLGIDSSKIERWLKENIPLAGGSLGKAATGVAGFTVAVVGSLLAAPLAITGAILGALVAGPIVLVAIISLLTASIYGSAQWNAMQGRGFSPGDIGGIELTSEELAALGEGHLALGLQNALSGCGISRVSSSNLTAVDTCLSEAGFSRTAIETIKYSAQEYDYLQCVGFVVAAVPGFSGGGDAYTFIDHPPAGWHSTSGPAQVGDVAVWGPSSACGGGSCSSNPACCGHVAVVTKVENIEGVSYLYVTQAWGESGKVSTVKVPIDGPTTILTRK